MPKVVDITVLTIDETPYPVEQFSDEVKELVGLYNEWNKKEAEVRDELLRFQAAKETLSRQIVLKAKSEIDEKNKENTDTAETEEQTNEE